MLADKMNRRNGALRLWEFSASAPGYTEKIHTTWMPGDAKG